MQITQIIQEILSHVSTAGGRYSDWYFGVAENGLDRLFNGHGVDQQLGIWITRECLDTKDARLVENYFLRLGMRGGPGGGSENTNWVYAYRITSATRQ